MGPGRKSTSRRGQLYNVAADWAWLARILVDAVPKLW